MEQVIAVNFIRTFKCVRAVMQVVKARRQRKIVNISSLSDKRGFAYLAQYSAAKTRVTALTQAAARELTWKGIYVNAVASKLVLTELSLQLLRANGEPWKKAFFLERLVAADEIARVVLASDDSSHIVSETINVNGGVYLE